MCEPQKDLITINRNGKEIVFNRNMKAVTYTSSDNIYFVCSIPKQMTDKEVIDFMYKMLSNF